MNSVNFALITALYDIKGANLYNEVYFPIINYELVNQYNTQVDTTKYYDLSDLQTLIKKDFGINIPLVVLKQSIRAIIKNNDEITLSEYENGKYYKILKAWDIAVKESVDVKSQEIQSNFNNLEQVFSFYLELEGLTCEKSFVDFYSDNSEDILAHFNGNESNPIINEQYANIAKFLDWLKIQNPELYNIANDVYWGSIIAGFLKRENVDLGIKACDAVEYYFDSSLVLATLDLASIDNVNYANELLGLILKTGNVPRVHAITIREVCSILNSVEKEQGPRSCSAIEEAYYRRNLTPSKILQIKNDLISLVENKGFVVTKEPASEIDKIEIEYKNKTSVKDLERFRGGGNNSIRDIHDVYLRDYIAKKRKDIVSLEKVNSYFVSLNSELISYFNKKYSGKLGLLLHPSKVVIDLWIHSLDSSLIKKSGLTELMSRCYALNNTDIRRKLSLFSKYYKETSMNYTPEAYTAVYRALVNRSTKVLQEFDGLYSIEQEIEGNKASLNQHHVEMIVKLAIAEDSNNKKRNIELQKQIEVLAEAKEVAEQGLKISEKWNDENEHKIKQLQEELRRRDKVEELDTEISKITKELMLLEKRRNKSVCMLGYYVMLAFEIILFLFVLLSILMFICDCLNVDLGVYADISIETFSFSAIISIIRTLCGPFYIFSPKIKYNEKRKEQIAYWEEQNPQYCELKQKIQKMNISKQDLLDKRVNIE